MEKKEVFTLPHSWSELTWQQLCDCWQVKMRYGGNADMARVEALLVLCGLTPVVIPTSRHLDTSTSRYNETTGERQFLLQSKTKDIFISTSRELSQMAQQGLKWFDYPYGDPGEKEVRDEKGKVIKEERPAKHGYVSQMRDAMILPLDTVKVGRFNGQWSMVNGQWFALPQPACNNLTWQQYRSLQAIAPQLFQEGMDEDATLDLQAQFLAHCLTPRSFALLDSTSGTIKMRPHWVFEYNSERAEGLVAFWKKKLTWAPRQKLSTLNSQLSTLFHICFQCYQTAIAYYAAVYPLLFAGDGKSNQIQDALQGEVGTINAVMMKANYSNQQEVYDSNLPFILDILNTMAKEAKEIERMNAKIKKK